MTLPASGAISLSDLVAEFGGDGSLTSYYRGAGLVGDTGTNAGVPTSGDISLTDFYGAENASDAIDVHAGTYGNPIPGQAGLYRLESDGDVIVGAGLDQGDWVTPKASAPGAYEARATLNSGTLASGTTGTWQALTTTRSWTCAFDGTANLTIEIRDGSAVVQDSGTVIINGGGGI